MLTHNVPNSNKTLEGNVFHLFYMNLNTAILFDKNLNEPIIFGGKTIVIGYLKKINEKMNVKPSKKILVFSYILGTEGFRRIQTFNGPIEEVGKFLIRY